MADNVTVISKKRNCYIEVVNRPSDPSNWIVRRSKKFLIFKKRIQSDWLLDKEQAFAYAEKMLQECEGKRQS
jgi:hypothetical protein